MPKLDNVSVVGSKEIWKSNDGQRVIFEVDLIYQGKPFKAKTYSKAISGIGWSGDVETYEKSGQRGIETFVKQPAREDTGNYPARSSQKATTTGNVTMYVSYAKDLAVAMQMTEGFDQVKFDILLQAVIEGGRTLYQADYEAKQSGELQYVPLDEVVEPTEAEAAGEMPQWLKDMPVDQ